jgi:rod shape determining protein RodA
MSLSEPIGAGVFSLGERFCRINWTLILLLALIASVGFATLYSAAGGSLAPWALRQMIRFAVCVCILILVALIDLRIWLRYAYAIYGVALVSVAATEVAGSIGMGAARWIDLGFMQFQPSEVMKVALLLALARYYHGVAAEDVNRLRHLFLPVGFAALPAVIVMRQPDLGTAIILLSLAAIMMFLAGFRIWKFMVVGAGMAALLPIAWNFLRDYQKKRVLTFLDPEADPLGAGYHIIQSKIALGSGGVFGKGFLAGTQGHLNFLPEKHTDFIFTMLAEEHGLVGAALLIGLYAVTIAYGIAIALRSRSHFGRLLAQGVTAMFFLYVFINIAMVTGMLPVVGVPLPLISYGGTSMLSLMWGFGLVMCVFVHRDIPISRHGTLA